MLLPTLELDPQMYVPAFKMSSRYGLSQDEIFRTVTPYYISDYNTNSTDSEYIKIQAVMCDEVYNRT